MEESVSDPDQVNPAQSQAVLDLYDESLGEVYGYLLRRCGSRTTAEDLTAETFLAAVDALRGDRPPDLSVAWLIRVARNKLVDHWRRREREERKLALLHAEPDPVDDAWDVVLDVGIAQDVLATLVPQHRAALALRYFDDLPTAEVAGLLGRSEGATEVLLVRARTAFRNAYRRTIGEEAP